MRKKIYILFFVSFLYEIKSSVDNFATANNQNMSTTPLGQGDIGAVINSVTPQENNQQGLGSPLVQQNVPLKQQQNIINNNTENLQANISNSFGNQSLYVDNALASVENVNKTEQNNYDRSKSTPIDGNSGLEVNNNAFLHDVRPSIDNDFASVGKDFQNKNDKNIENRNEIKKSEAEKIFEKIDSSYVTFDLQGKTLYELVLALAEFKKINILIPTSLEAEKVTVNFALKDQIPIEEVEEYFIYFLSMAGYILTLQDDIYVIAKKTMDDNLRRQNLPLYVNVPPKDLPDNMAYIRVIHFLKHIKVPAQQGAGGDSIRNILLSLLPDNRFGVMVDTRTNSLILTGPSNAIASALLIINEIDRCGEPDYVFSMSLAHTNVGYVMKLIESILSITKNDNSSLGSTNIYHGPSYFSPHLKVVPDPVQNSIIFLGSKDTVERMVTFIKEEIDIKEADGRSTIHVYELQYLDSKKIAPVLQDLVNGDSSKDQSTKDQSGKSEYRRFDKVRVIPEEVVPAKRMANNEKVQTKLTLGGNKLIISASDDDFNELSKIINCLDQPQPQIIVEIIILDLYLSDIKNFSSNSGIPSFFTLPFGSTMQSIMLDNSRVMLQNPGSQMAVTSASHLTPSTSMKADILATIESTEAGGAITSLANTAPRNGLIISLGEQYKNSSIWSILQLEENISKRNVVQNPTVITQNNMPAKIENIVVKRGVGELSPNNTQYGGATVVNVQSYTAALGISITPRISFGSCRDSDKVRLNLEINMAIEDFKNDLNTDFTKYNRALKTNANLSSGDILVLGGLRKEVYTESVSGVPFLKDIPLIGGLFRKVVKQKDEANLYMCIRARVIDSPGELEEYTKKQTNVYKSERAENILSDFIGDFSFVPLSKNDAGSAVVQV